MVDQVVRQWAAISFGEGHAAGVSGQGEVFTWGRNDLGQVGQNVGHDKDVPTKMEILKGWDVRALACGAHHTVALTPEDVISWGANSEGQCGQGERAETLWVKPRSIKPLQGQSVSQVVCGKYHTLCVTATSQVTFCSWLRGGMFSHAYIIACCIGLAFASASTLRVVAAAGASPVAAKLLGCVASICVSSNSLHVIKDVIVEVCNRLQSMTLVQVFAWGLNTSGQLGLNDALTRKSPAVVDALWAMPVQQLAAGQICDVNQCTTMHCDLVCAHIQRAVHPEWLS